MKKRETSKPTASSPSLLDGRALAGVRGGVAGAGNVSIPDNNSSGITTHAK